MTDLAVFLLARIADDESLARQAGDHALDDLAAATAAARINRMQFAHFHHWSPSRVLAECEATRRIIELHDHPDGSCWEMHRGVYGPGWPEGSYAVEGQPWAHLSLEPPEVHPGPCETLQLLALPYADHPDYRAEWRP